jgi:hypothetical protein
MSYRNDLEAAVCQLDDVQKENTKLKTQLNEKNKQTIKFKLYKITEIFMTIVMILCAGAVLGVLVFFTGEKFGQAFEGQDIEEITERVLGTEITRIKLGESKKALSQLETERKWFEFQLDEASYIHFNMVSSTKLRRPDYIKFCIWARGYSKTLMKVHNNGIVRLPKGMYRFSLCVDVDINQRLLFSVELNKMIKAGECNVGQE